MPRTRKTAARRKRDYVLPNEVDRLLKAATSTGRHAHRNYTLILLGYRHGLRLSELIDLRWSMIDFKRKTLRVSRALNGIDTVHPLGKKELQALRKLRKDYPRSAYLFITDSGRQLGQRTASRIVAEAGERAGLRFHLSPSMLRHGCGHALANAGHSIVAVQHYLGHRDIRHTMRYTELPEHPFKGFWND
jgi:integrase